MIKEYFKNFYSCYGILGIASAVAVFFKMALFYFFIGSITNIVPVLVVSCILIYLLFSSFRNKWIPAGIFAALSVLMFCDVMYSSFFSRYLSINMIASAAFLRDIAASIWEVFRASFLLLFADVVLVFICLIRQDKTGKPQVNEEDEFFTAFETDFAALEGEEERVVASRRKRRKRKKFSMIKWIVLHAKQLTAGLIIVILAINITNSNLVKSISNQEIITYHIKDVAYRAFALTGNTDDLSAFKDPYLYEKNGPFFGIAADRNLVAIQLESFQNFVVGLEYNGQEITPNLNRLLEENTAYFDHYYQQIGSGNTSDAEFASNNSIYGALMSYTNKLYGSRNYFRGLPVMLKEKGYETAVFHAFEKKYFWSRDIAFPNMGFDKFYGGLNNRPGDGVYEMKEWMGWGLTDTYFYEQTINFMEELKEPFYSLVISLSNHHPYKMLDHYQFIELLPEDEDTMVGNYLKSAAYTDHALGQFFDDLKSKGWYDNSVIAIYGDHVGLTRSDEVDASMERLLGRPYDFDVIMNVPLIITVPNAEKDIRQTISVAGGQLDFFPTIAYLMGFDELDTLYLGHNLFSIKEGLVAEQTYMTKGSFFKNDMAFEMSRDGVFENGRAWNLKTGEPIPLSECYDDYAKAMEIINTSEYILRSDAIRRIYLEGEDAEEAFSLNVARTHPHSIVIAKAPGKIYGNSIEDIEYVYKEDHRCIRIDMEWTDKIDEPEPIAINSRTGRIEMTHEELIDWMETHADTNIVVNIQRSGDYFMRFMSEQSPAIEERLILELPELSEYTGKHDAIINISNISQSVDEIRDFIEKNNVWAILMTKEEAEGKFESLMELNTGIYIMGETDGFITKAN